MTDPLALVTMPAPAMAAVPVVVPALTAEVLIAPSAVLQSLAGLAATVMGRSPDGTLMVKSSYGTLSLKTTQPLPAGTRVELRLQSGNPQTVSIVTLPPEPDAAEPPPTTQLDLGTTFTATVIAPPPGPPSAAGPGPTPGTTPTLDASADIPAIGARLLLRVAAPALPAGPTTLQGQVAAGPAGETVIETPIGTIALDQRIGLPPGTAIALEMLETNAPADIAAEPPPTLSSGWPTLDQALAILDKTAPGLAQQMRAELTPATAPAFAGTLLFMMGALYGGRWPGDAVGRALTAAGHGKLSARLGEDVSELTRLSDDRTTGKWQVMVVPLLTGTTVEPLRIYLPRRDGGGDKAEDGTRFVIEAELSRLGALQLDGLVRGRRFDLVLRSHTPLPAELTAEAGALFRNAIAAAGFHGDIVFATAAEFGVAPMAKLRDHIAVSV